MCTPKQHFIGLEGPIVVLCQVESVAGYQKSPSSQGRGSTLKTLSKLTKKWGQDAAEDISWYQYPSAVTMLVHAPSSGICRKIIQLMFYSCFYVYLPRDGSEMVSFCATTRLCSNCPLKNVLKVSGQSLVRVIQTWNRMLLTKNHHIQPRRNCRIFLRFKLHHFSDKNMSCCWCIHPHVFAFFLALHFPVFVAQSLPIRQTSWEAMDVFSTASTRHPSKGSGFQPLCGVKQARKAWSWEWRPGPDPNPVYVSQYVYTVVSVCL